MRNRVRKRERETMKREANWSEDKKKDDKFDPNGPRILAVKPKKKQLRCLKCGKMVLATANNRICKNCKRNGHWNEIEPERVFHFLDD